MSLTFMNFKQVIPAPILKRGRDYWQRSYISELEYDEEDACWEAQVAGTELYEVRVERQPDGTLACSCTCPYEAGEHCKHIAAVLYAIEETFPELLNSELRKPAPARPLKRDHLRQLLENAPRQTLIDILLDLTRRDRELRNQLLIQLDPENAGTSAYRRIVRDMLRAGRGHDNFLDYRGASQAGRKVQQMCVQAQGWAAAGEVARAVAFYQAVIEEVIAAMGHADDSNGELGAGISMALEGLAENISLLDASEGEALFNYCIAQARSEMMNGWDWQWELIGIAVSQAHSAERVAALTAALDEMEAKVAQEPDDRFSRSYALEYIVTYKAELIERFDGRQAARDFLKTYMSLDKVRMDFIEEYLQEGRLDEAVQLIQEGIASSERRRLAGLTQQYRAFWLPILQQQGDKRAVISVARKLWLHNGDEAMFVVLKQTVPAAEWHQFIDSLVEDLRREPHRVAPLYAQEQRWEDLLKLIKSSSRPHLLLEDYYKQLAVRFPDEVAAIYEHTIENMLQVASNRETYQQVVSYLHRIIRLVGEERGIEIAEQLRSRYASRRALLDELGRL